VRGVSFGGLIDGVDTIFKIGLEMIFDNILFLTETNDNMLIFEML
jgi:hypothetical protein